MESDNKFERIGGTSTGGGTFWGMGCLLTKAKVSRVRMIMVGFRCFAVFFFFFFSVEVSFKKSPLFHQYF